VVRWERRGSGPRADPRPKLHRLSPKTNRTFQTRHYWWLRHYGGPGLDGAEGTRQLRKKKELCVFPLHSLGAGPAIQRIHEKSSEHRHLVFLFSKISQTNIIYHKRHPVFCTWCSDVVACHSGNGTQCEKNAIIFEIFRFGRGKNGEIMFYEFEFLYFGVAWGGKSRNLKDTKIMRWHCF